jgi:hypothetical protein
MIGAVFALVKGGKHLKKYLNSYGSRFAPNMGAMEKG